MGQDPSGRGRRLLRLGLLLLAAYGPLAPAVLLFLLVVPVLVLITGWPWWLRLLLVLWDVLLLVGAALWLGPRALAEVRAFLDEERRRN